MTTQPSRRSARHIVHFYQDRADLGERAATYLAIPLLAGGRAAVIALAEHRDEILAQLATRGLDVGRLRAGGRLLLLDAVEVMGQILTSEGPDPAAFRRVVLEKLQLRPTGGGPGMRIYGEIVDQLTRHGHLDHAIALERLWDQVLEGHEGELLCGYSAEHVAGLARESAFHTICSVHGDSAEEASDAVTMAVLRQEVRTLRAEVADRRDLEKGLRRMQGDLVQARRLEAAAVLAGGIAHHYNNLMCVIAGYAHLLQESLQHEPELQAQAREICCAADRVNALTRQMMYFSSPKRNESGQVEPDAGLRSLWPLVRHRIPSLIQMELYLGAAGHCVALGPAELELVVLALVNNAREAMPGGGRLTLRTRLAGASESPAASASSFGQAIVLELADTGVGMDDSVKARAFEPFFTTRGLASSSGLGLSSVHGLVSAAGGQVLLDSAPGRGTRVQMDLPVIAAMTRPLRMPIASASPQVASKVVLVVEDEEAVRRMVTSALRKQGYRVLEASGGNQAVQLLELFTEGVDLLLTDILMPDMDGPTLVSRVRASMPGVPVLYMSGRHEAQDEQVDGTLINKPFTTRTLVRAVEAELERAALKA